MAIITQTMPFPANATAKCGVYAFVNTTNGKYYIGSSRDMNTRRSYHLWALRRNRHSNPHFQRAWNLCGESAFEFVVLEETTEDRLLTCEQWYLDACSASDMACGYNMSRIANGASQSEDGRRRISEARKGKAQRPAGWKMPEEHKAKIGDANRGKKRPPMSEERKAFHAGILAKHRNHPRTPEWNARNAAAKRGTAASPETKAKMSESQRRRWAIRKQSGGTS